MQTGGNILQTRFVIPGEPHGKGRPRFTINQGYVHTYTPKSTSDYEDLVRDCYALQCRDIYFDKDSAIGVNITGYFAPPASASKKVKLAMLSGSIQHTKKIDCDNLAKIILDSLNGLAYHDDRQIVDLRVQKKYAEEPSVQVEIWEIIN